MTEPTFARRFREWFLRDLTIREGYCVACAAAVTTTGPRGGRVWGFDGHTDDCLFLAIYHELLRGDDMMHDKCEGCAKASYDCPEHPDECSGPHDAPSDWMQEDADD